MTRRRGLAPSAVVAVVVVWLFGAAGAVVAAVTAVVVRWLCAPEDPTLADDDLLDAALRPVTRVTPCGPPRSVPTARSADAVDRLLESS